MKGANQSERHHLAILRERLAREKLYGGPQRFPDLLTPEMERRVRDSLRIVNLEHAGAGRKRRSETLAIRVFDEVGMLHGRGVLNDEQAFAAEKLQRDFHAAGLEGVKAINYLREVADTNAGLERHVVDTIDSVDRYVRALRVVPRSCWPIVRDVVLAERRIDAIAVRGMSNRKLRRLKVITLLQCGLDELAQFYGFDRRKQRKHAKMNGHARSQAADFGSSASVENVSEGG